MLDSKVAIHQNVIEFFEGDMSPITKMVVMAMSRKLLFSDMYRIGMTAVNKESGLEGSFDVYIDDSHNVKVVKVG